MDTLIASDHRGLQQQGPGVALPEITRPGGSNPRATDESRVQQRGRNGGSATKRGCDTDR